MNHKVLRRIAGAIGPMAASPWRSPPASRSQGASARRERPRPRRSASAARRACPSRSSARAPPPRCWPRRTRRTAAKLEDADFVERFARFANAQLNPEPGANVAEDASYTLAKYVLENDKPWKDMFVGKYDVTDEVTEDPNGLGYFRSDAWMRRYAGNEDEGYRIVAAYRILQNTTGLKLTATTNVDGVDLSATGRAAAACKGCHYDNWYALDKVSKVLSRRKGKGNNMTFDPPTDGPQQILGGKTIKDDQEFVEALVASENFKFRACRVAFEFLYGRAESTCEGAVFDKCVDAFVQDGSMKTAIATIAKDPSFCQ